MNLIIRKASTLTTEEQTALGILGIPSNWPVESYPYVDTIPANFELISEEACIALKANNQAAYDSWLAAKSPIINPKPDAIQIMGANNRIQDPVLKGVLGATGVTFTTHDFTDRTTWYQKSIRVTEEELTDSGNGLTFNSLHPHWIDIYSKKLMFLRNKINKRDGTFSTHSAYAVVVRVNSVVQTSGYSVDFEAGTITFNSSQTGNTVDCSYSHNDGITNRSEWLLTPPAGKSYILDHVEIQFSKGITFSGIIRFEVWAGNTVTYFTGANWADALFEGGYGQMRADYQDIRGVINQCNLGTGSIPACPNAGTTEEVLVFPFDYVKSIPLDGDQGLLIRTVILNDIPLTTAEICTVSFYTQIVSN
jgi:hypothetical protein